VVEEEGVDVVAEAEAEEEGDEVVAVAEEVAEEDAATAVITPEKNMLRAKYYSRIETGHSSLFSK